MRFSVPEFPEEHRSRLPFRAERFPQLRRSESFTSSHTFSLLNGPEFKHHPLRYDIDRRKHRTLVGQKGHDGQITYPKYPHCTASSDDLYESHLRNVNNGSSGETFSQTSNDSLEESCSETGTSEPNGGLCKRCCMISIDTLSEEEGYTHSKLDILEESARSCGLCRTFFDAFYDDFWWEVIDKWTLDRYKMRLSLNLGASGKKVRPDHPGPDQMPRACIWVGFFDTRPWQVPEFNPEILEQDPEDSVKPRQQEEVRLGRKRMLCYTEEGDSAMFAGLPWVRKRIEYTGSAGSLSIANGWLKQCLAAERLATNIAHDIGDQDAVSRNANDDLDLESLTTFAAERPTRLLEILSADDPDNPHPHSVKLVETNGLDYTYVALSYCWGEIAGTTWLTKHDTIHHYMQGIDLESLPATITDCVKIAASLGVYHVWVDALCIIQDSTSDWEMESAKMGGIYRGALLTIAALKSNSSSEGCFNQHEGSSDFNPFTRYTCVESRLRNGQTSRLYFERSIPGFESPYHHGPYESEVDKSPLSKRAWAYQEQVLSRRILYFAKSQLYWECDHCRLSQDNLFQSEWKRQYPVLTFKAPLSTKTAASTWYHDVVDAYTKRRLTNPNDKLVAISAVAKATYLNRHVRYVAGLWEDCILPGLCWYRDGEGGKNMTYRCPSWSWASQQSAVSYGECPVTYENPPEENIPSVVKLLNIQIVPSEENPFGNVHRGHITLHTMVAEGTVLRERVSRYEYDYYAMNPTADRRSLVIFEKSGRHVWHGEAVLDDEGHRFEKVVVALVHNGWTRKMSRWLLLLLKQTGEEEHTYRRVGLGVVEEDYNFLTRSCERPNFERDWTEQVITIV